MIFYRTSNNGVIAVIPEHVFLEREQQRERELQMQEVTEGREPGDHVPFESFPTPVFTFVHREYLEDENAPFASFVTGDLELLDTLLRGHTVMQRDFCVPFSNGIQAHPDDPHYAQELGFRTTAQQLIDEFQLVRAS